MFLLFFKTKGWCNPHIHVTPSRSAYVNSLVKDVDIQIVYIILNIYLYQEVDHDYSRDVALNCLWDALKGEEESVDNLRSTEGPKHALEGLGQSPQEALGF